MCHVLLSPGVWIRLSFALRYRSPYTFCLCLPLLDHFQRSIKPLDTIYGSFRPHRGQLLSDPCAPIWGVMCLFLGFATTLNIHRFSQYRKKCLEMVLVLIYTSVSK